MSTPEEGDRSVSHIRPWVRRNWKWICGSVLAVLILSRFTLHLGYIDEEKTQAAELIGQFHDRMNAGQFDQIYDDADPALRKASTRQEWLQHMQKTREQYGLFKKMTSSELNVLMGAPVQTRAAYNSVFEKGDATEVFSFAREGYKLQLLLYGISPGTTPLTWDEDLRVAQEAAQRFYERMAASQYETIYGDMSDDLKDTATPDSMIAFLKQINERLGVCNAATLVGSDYSKARGRFVGLVYKRRCAHGDVNETLAWKITGGRAFLRAYKPSGPALKID